MVLADCTLNQTTATPAPTIFFFTPLLLVSGRGVALAGVKGRQANLFACGASASAAAMLRHSSARVHAAPPPPADAMPKDKANKRFMSDEGAPRPRGFHTTPLRSPYVAARSPATKTRARKTLARDRVLEPQQT